MVLTETEDEHPANLGIDFDVSIHRIYCPVPGACYYAQVQAGGPSVCIEGSWDGLDIIASATGQTRPMNDSICNAYYLGTVPDNGVLPPAAQPVSPETGIAGEYTNMCATPDVAWDADPNQPLENDVWFTFTPPASGSVLITATSGGTSGNDLDLEMAVWESLNDNCADPRHLFIPLEFRDHGLFDAVTDLGDITDLIFQYDIYATAGCDCGDALCIADEGNDLLLTCLDPTREYYIQVDGGSYAACDLFQPGLRGCVAGDFEITITDAMLPPAPHDKICNAIDLGVPPTGAGVTDVNTNRCANNIFDPTSTGFASDHTVWYCFTAPASGCVNVDIDNTCQTQGGDNDLPGQDFHDDIDLQFAVFDAVGLDCVNGTIGSYDEITSEYN